MLIEAEELADGTRIEADLCLIGGGMASITLAHELAGSGVRIAILEGGGRDPSGAQQDIYAGRGVMTDSAGGSRDFGDYLRASRVRAYGGSGHVWGGKCGRLEPADFSRRDWIRGSGWPFDRDQLDPFYDRASVLLALPSFRDDLTGKDPSRPELPIGDGRDFRTVARFHSPITGSRSKERFDEFRFAPTRRENVVVYLGATVTEIETNPTSSSVTGLTIRTLGGKRHRAIAPVYVLATGGMENARLLLASTGTNPKGLGNDRDLVGRHFGGHLNCSADGGADGATSGAALGRLGHSFDLYVTQDVTKVWGVLNVTTAAQRTHRIPNFWATFSPPWFEVRPTDRGVARYAGAMGSGSGDRGAFIPVRVMAEEPPNPESRVSLSDDRDALGQRRLQLDWRLSSDYVRGVEDGVALFAKALGQAGTGRIRWPVTRDAILPSLGAARHHIGTTRMGSDPSRGVVDAHGKLHGVANLYVAGSSIFPTTGIVNPTLTIVALTMRLADHLRSRLGGAR